MAVMLDNYMKYKGNEFGENIYGTESGKEDNDSGSQMEGSLSSVRQSVFADEEMIAAWAKESVHSTVDSGILQGRSDGTFGPHDSFTRAEMSVVAERICYRELLSRLG